MAVANPITTPSRPKGMFRRDFMKMQPLLLAAVCAPKLTRLAKLIKPSVGVV